MNHTNAMGIDLTLYENQPISIQSKVSKRGDSTKESIRITFRRMSTIHQEEGSGEITCMMTRSVVTIICIQGYSIPTDPRLHAVSVKSKWATDPGRKTAIMLWYNSQGKQPHDRIMSLKDWRVVCLG